MNNRMFDEYAMDNNMINEMIISNNIDNIAGSYEGYIKGNMFNNIYDQYKNYKPSNLIPNSEQEELLLNINQTCFAAHDIRLYLDLNPNDKEMINLFNNYQQQANNAIKEYEKRYGPILSTSLSNDSVFNWEENDFPWEKGDK